MVAGLAYAVIENESVIALRNEVERYRLSLSLRAYSGISATGYDEHRGQVFAEIFNVGINEYSIVVGIQIDSFVFHSKSPWCYLKFRIG
jgi:hypothetical protein